LVVNWISIVVVVILLIGRRQIQRAPALAFMLAGCVTLVAWWLWFGNAYDRIGAGDRPSAIGVEWGMRLQPYFCLLAWIWLFRRVKPIVPSAKGRGFELVTHPISPVGEMDVKR